MPRGTGSRIFKAILYRKEETWDFPNVHWQGMDKYIMLYSYSWIVYMEKTLMLRKIEGKRMGQQRTRWLDGSTNSMDMSLSKLWEIGRTGKLVHGVENSQTRLRDWRTTTTPVCPYYTITSIITLFQISSLSEMLGIRSLAYLFRRQNSTHNTFLHAKNETIITIQHL